MGNGNSTINNLYRFTDSEAQNGLNYYRLKQVDFDNTFQYSRIVSANVIGSNQFDFTILPNPSKDKIEVKNLKSGSTVELISSLNRIEKSAIVTGETLEFKIQNLNAGLYFIRVKQQNGNIATKKLIVE